MKGGKNYKVKSHFWKVHIYWKNRSRDSGVLEKLYVSGGTYFDNTQQGKKRPTPGSKKTHQKPQERKAAHTKGENTNVSREGYPGLVARKNLRKTRGKKDSHLDLKKLDNSGKKVIANILFGRRISDFLP